MKNITLLALSFVLGNALPLHAEERASQVAAKATTVLPISDADVQAIYASVKKPTTLRELYDNYVIIKKNRLLLRADFYTTENITNFMGCKDVIWGVNNKGTKKATLIYSDAVNSYIGIMPPSNNKLATQYYGVGDTEKNNHISSRITLWDEETTINKKLNKIFSTQLNGLLPNMMDDDVDLSTLIGGYIFYQNQDVYQPIFMAKDEKQKLVYPKNPTDLLNNIKYALKKQLFLRVC